MKHTLSPSLIMRPYLTWDIALTSFFFFSSLRSGSLNSLLSMMSPWVNMVYIFPSQNLWPDDGSRPWPSSQHSPPLSQDKGQQWTSSPRLHSLRSRHLYESDESCTWFYVTSIRVCQERHWTVHSIAVMMVKIKIDNHIRANLVTKSWVCSLLTTMGKRGKLGDITYQNTNIWVNALLKFVFEFLPLGPGGCLSKVQPWELAYRKPGLEGCRSWRKCRLFWGFCWS